eukprot:SAG22_NODE_8346_length_662_cov_1.241563_1_plen_126_part_01
MTCFFLQPPPLADFDLAPSPRTAEVEHDEGKQHQQTAQQQDELTEEDVQDPELPAALGSLGPPAAAAATEAPAPAPLAAPVPAPTPAPAPAPAAPAASAGGLEAELARATEEVMTLLKAGKKEEAK